MYFVFCNCTIYMLIMFLKHQKLLEYQIFDIFFLYFLLEFDFFFYEGLGSDSCNFSKIFESHTSSSASHGWKSFGDGFDFRNPPDPFSKQETLTQDPAIEQPLPVTLEELFTGTTKKLKINHRVLSTNNAYIQEEKILQIDVKPGWKAGTKVTFPREGDMKPGVIAADIIFVVTDKAHQYFKRDSDNNLLYVAKLNLRDALVGCMINVPTIDGRVLSIQVNEVIQPGTQKRIPGEGLPIPKRNGERADMIVAFDVAFPTNLSNEQREFLATLPF